MRGVGPESVRQSGAHSPNSSVPPRYTLLNSDVNVIGETRCYEHRVEFYALRAVTMKFPEVNEQDYDELLVDVEYSPERRAALLGCLP